MILQCTLAPAGDDGHVLQPGIALLFYRILDSGLLTMGSISLGMALVAGRKRVP